MDQQRLWRAVIYRAWLDATGSGIPANLRPDARAQVVAWLDDPDFDQVCRLAGLNDAAVRRRFDRLLAITGWADQGDRFVGLDPEVVDEIRFTQLDKPTYLNELRSLGPDSALAKVRLDLDRDLRVKEALA